MEWKPVLYGLIITLLYIPMVFLGATTVFPDDGTNWFEPKSNCYDRTGPYPEPANSEELNAWNAENEACQAENEADRLVWEEQRESLEAKRYILVTVMNLIILGIAAFVTVLAVPVATGLFAGSTLATFIATLTYFESANEIGFGLLVVVFFVVVFFISKATGKSKKKRKK